MVKKVLISDQIFYCFCPTISNLFLIFKAIIHNHSFYLKSITLSKLRYGDHFRYGDFSNILATFTQQLANNYPLLLG